MPINAQLKKDAEKEVEYPTLTPRKTSLLEALKKHKGLITKACLASGVARRTYYAWYHEDEDFKKAVDSVQDFVLDEVEDCAHQLIEDGNPAMIIFYLKCKGKKRGYIEKQQIEYSTGDLSTLRDAMNEAAKECEKEF